MVGDLLIELGHLGQEDHPPGLLARRMDHQDGAEELGIELDEFRLVAGRPERQALSGRQLIDEKAKHLEPRR